MSLVDTETAALLTRVPPAVCVAWDLVSERGHPAVDYPEAIQAAHAILSEGWRPWREAWDQVFHTPRTGHFGSTMDRLALIDMESQILRRCVHDLQLRDEVVAVLLVGTR